MPWAASRLMWKKAVAFSPVDVDGSYRTWFQAAVAILGGLEMTSTIFPIEAAKPWQAVIDTDPEVLVVAPCGFGM